MTRNEKTEDFMRRTRALGIDVLRIVDSFPRSLGASVVARQLARSATSVGANYRAACHVQSQAEMAAKLHIVEEEADEVLYWLSIDRELEYAPLEQVQSIETEGQQLLAMTVASILTLKGKRDKQKPQPA